VFFRRVNHWLDRLEQIITAITGFILGSLAVLVGWQVVARYIFSSGQFWAEQLALVSMMWVALLGAAGCVWTDSHVRLNIVLTSLPTTARLIVLTILDGIVLWFSFVVVKEGISLAERTMGGEMSALGIPIGTTYIVLPTAAVLMIIFTLVRAIGRFVKENVGKDETS
jgi:TRAP-type C4-dicarboxylate transport system permease small subunit